MSDTTFGKYQLIAELGHGGMADVFLAVQGGFTGSGFRKLTVVKRLRENLADEPEFVAMLVDEARIAARLNHPNVVQTNEVGECDGRYFIAMEYLDGQPLHRVQHRSAQRAKDGSPPIFGNDLQYVVLMDVLAGLHHAHQLKDYDGTPLEIVHRDVTPHNIFVTYEGQVKVVDFGIAKAAGRSAETRQGIIKGKVRYMAPEQAVGQNVDCRVDVFAVGVMLWEIASGKRMWRDKDDLQIVQALVSGQVPRSPKSVTPEVPDALDAICVKALAHRPEDRYASADELRNDLEQYLIDAGILSRARRQIPPALDLLFKDKRTEIRDIIEKQLADLDSKESGEFAAVALAPASSNTLSTSASSALSTSGTGSSETIHSSTGSVRTSEGLLAAPGRSRPVLAAFGAAVLVAAMLVFGAVALGMRGSHAGGSAGQNEEVNIRITVSPTTAVVVLDDGAPESVPFGRTVKRDNRQHKVTIEADGYLPKHDFITFAQDSVLSFDLTRDPTTLADDRANNTQPAPSSAASIAAHANGTGKTIAHAGFPTSKHNNTTHAPTADPPAPGPAPAPAPAPAPQPATAPQPQPTIAITPTPAAVDVAAEHRKAVNRSVRTHAAEVQGCYDRTKMTTPNLAGAVTVGANLTPSGTVASAQIANSTVGSTMLESCLADRFRSWVFPPPPPGASSAISYTFRFE